MNIEPVGNRDRCGKCGVRHGGNNHLCDVHGKVSQGCCETSCNPRDYVQAGKLHPVFPSTLAPQFKLKLRADVDLSNAKLHPPYTYQDDGSGRYKPEYIERYIL